MSPVKRPLQSPHEESWLGEDREKKWTNTGYISEMQQIGLVR